MTITPKEFQKAIDRANKTGFDDLTGYDGMLALADLVMDHADDFSNGLSALRDSDPSHLDRSALDVIENANENSHKRPNMRTLMEEVAEAVLADRGKHDDPLELELTQIAGVCINMLRRIRAGEDVGLKS